MSGGKSATGKGVRMGTFDNVARAAAAATAKDRQDADALLAETGESARAAVLAHMAFAALHGALESARERCTREGQRIDVRYEPSAISVSARGRWVRVAHNAGSTTIEIRPSVTGQLFAPGDGVECWRPSAADMHGVFSEAAAVAEKIGLYLFRD